MWGGRFQQPNLSLCRGLEAQSTLLPESLEGITYSNVPVDVHTMGSVGPKTFACYIFNTGNIGTVLVSVVHFAHKPVPKESESNFYLKPIYSGHTLAVYECISQYFIYVRHIHPTFFLTFLEDFLEKISARLEFRRAWLPPYLST